jgi:hypothetical protein
MMSLRSVATAAQSHGMRHHGTRVVLLCHVKLSRGGEEMAEAKITLTLTPAEFDLIRWAVRFAQNNEHEVARDGSTDIKLRNESRAKEFKLSELSKKLS